MVGWVVGVGVVGISVEVLGVVVGFEFEVVVGLVVVGLVVVGLVVVGLVVVGFVVVGLVVVDLVVAGLVVVDVTATMVLGALVVGVSVDVDSVEVVVDIAGSRLAFLILGFVVFSTLFFASVSIFADDVVDIS